MHQADNGVTVAGHGNSTDITISGLPKFRRWPDAPEGIGFERDRPVRMKRSRISEPNRYRYLGEHPGITGEWYEDVDAEHTAWPEMLDQRALGQFCGAYDFEDVEEDDWPGGDIVDGPHDALEEDGI